jgi:PAS domain S-box-containing protein
MKKPDTSSSFFKTEIKDLRERNKILEKELKANRKYFQAILNGIADPICVKDLKHCWVLVNDAFCDIAGHKRETLIGKSDYDIFPKEEADVFWKMDNEVFDTGKENINEETITDSKNVTRTIITKKTLFRDPVGGNLIVAIGRDITERKMSEQALRDEKEKAQRYLDIAGVIMMVIGSDQNVKHINKKGCEVLGYKEEEIVGKNWFDNFLPEREREKVKEVFVVLLSGDAEPVEYFENSILTKKDEERIIAWHNIFLRDDDGSITGTLSSGEDITEKKQAEDALRKSEENLRQSHKMEAVGRLAGGIAHDFNNLLTAIIGYSEILRMNKSLDSSTQHNVNEILKSADRAANLTQQLLAFSRKQILQPSTIDLNKLINDLHKMLTRLIGENIDLKTELKPQLWYVKADPGQIEQVVMNLVINARDAIQGRGRLTVKTDNVYLDGGYVKISDSVRPGKYVLLSVQDTGHGLDKEQIKYIFEPFYTTKGKGTGLGLSTVYGIVKQSGGYITVDSNPDKGTTFEILMPVVEEIINYDKDEIITEKPKRGTETIMVVEDEDAVRKMISRVLEGFGYKVITAENGDEALKIMKKQEKGSVDMLVTDVIMPGTSGKELMKRLTADHPLTKVLYISGYTDDVIVDHGVLEKGISFLQKPFSPNVFLKRVRKVLDTAD